MIVGSVCFCYIFSVSAKVIRNVILRIAMGLLSAWQTLCDFILLTFQICDLHGEFQGKKIYISLSLIRAVDKMYGCTTNWCTIQKCLR